MARRCRIEEASYDDVAWGVFDGASPPARMRMLACRTVDRGGDGLGLGKWPERAFILLAPHVHHQIVHPTANNRSKGRRGLVGCTGSNLMAAEPFRESEMGQGDFLDHLC